MAYIFVHIGLPKTATTTIQKDILEKLPEENKLKYFGVKHPRKASQEKLFREFYCFISTGDNLGSIKEMI
ncbi:hypothetical protein, partial [Tamlana crocina]